jgi:hypothetical protein
MLGVAGSSHLEVQSFFCVVGPQLSLLLHLVGAAHS